MYCLECFQELITTFKEFKMLILTFSLDVIFPSINKKAGSENIKNKKATDLNIYKLLKPIFFNKDATPNPINEPVYPKATPKPDIFPLFSSLLTETSSAS